MSYQSPIIYFSEYFLKRYNWDFHPDWDPFLIEGWELLASQGGIDPLGYFDGGSAVYRVPNFRGFDRYVSVLVHYTEILRIEWYNDRRGVSWPEPVGESEATVALNEALMKLFGPNSASQEPITSEPVPTDTVASAISATGEVERNVCE